VLNRRDFLWSGSAFLAASSHARDREAPIAAISDYERSSGGHIGVYAENIRTGAKLSWRADERFVMCSTFKASLEQQGCAGYTGISLQWVKSVTATLNSPAITNNAKILANQYWQEYGAQMLQNLGCGA
jgi:hypothetical protein